MSAFHPFSPLGSPWGLARPDLQSNPAVGQRTARLLRAQLLGYRLLVLQPVGSLGFDRGMAAALSDSTACDDVEPQPRESLGKTIRRRRRRQHSGRHLPAPADSSPLQGSPQLYEMHTSSTADGPQGKCSRNVGRAR